MDREKLQREADALTEELGLYARSPAPFPALEDSIVRRAAYCQSRISEIAKKLQT